MAPMERPEPASVLAKIKILTGPIENGVKALEQAAKIGGLEVNVKEHSVCVAPNQAKGKGHAYAEWALRWTLERSSSKAHDYVLNRSAWEILRLLVLQVPPTISAKLLNANHVLDLVKECLEQTVRKYPAVKPPSRKRKRDAEDKSAFGCESDGQPASERSQLPLILGNMSRFLTTIMILSDPSIQATHAMTAELGPAVPNTNLVAQEHMRSVLRTTTLQAAEILGLWLQCLSNLSAQKDSLDLETPAAETGKFSSMNPFIHIWKVRSRESDDNLGSSARTFSKVCLVPAVSLYAQLISGPALVVKYSRRHQALKATLEQLLARHLFLPARASFSPAKDRSKRTIPNGEGQLFTFLEPLRATIAKSTTMTRSALVLILTHLLQLAIKLSPQVSPQQKSNELPWIENVFSALSRCAGEPVPFSFTEYPTVGVDLSPITGMLQVILDNSMKLSSEFLESILIDYSGLIDIAERYAIRGIFDHDLQGETIEKPRWELISILLRLDGSIFLKKFASDSTLHRTNYIGALVNSLAGERWIPEVRATVMQTSTLSAPSIKESQDASINVSWDGSVKTCSQRIIIPLLQAYASTRDLSSFIDQWFRELRRDWGLLGTPEGARLIWTTKWVSQAFWAIVEDSLTPAKINEHLVEYTLPVKVLAKEVANVDQDGGTIDWSAFAPTAPASAALIMLDAILKGVNREDSFRQHTPTLKGLTALMFDYTSFDLSNFPCGSKIWSILTRLLELASRVDTKVSLQAQREKVIATGVLDTARVVIDIGARSAIPSPACDLGIQAYRFVHVVCSDMLDLPDLREKAEGYIRFANDWLHNDTGQFEPSDAIQHLIEKEGEMSDFPIGSRLMESLLVLNQFPQAFQLFSIEQRKRLFSVLFYFVVAEQICHGNLNTARESGHHLDPSIISFRTLLKATWESILCIGSYGVREDFIHCMMDMLPPAEHMGMRGDPSVTDVAITTLLNISPAAITRKDREAILDRLSDLFIENKNAEDEKLIMQRNKYIAIMVHLSREFNPTTMLCIDANVLWNIANVFDAFEHKEQASKEALEPLIELFKIILEQAFSDQTLERTQVFIDAFAKLAGGTLMPKNSPSSFRDGLATILLLKSWFNALAASKLISDHQHLAKLCHERLVQNIAEIAKNELTSVQKWAILKSFAEFPYTAAGFECRDSLPSKSLDILLTNALDVDLACYERKDETADPSSFSTHVHLLKAVSLFRKPADTVKIAAQLLRQNLTAKDYGQALNIIKDWMKELDTAQRVEVFETLLTKRTTSARCGTMQMLHIAIQTLTTTDSVLLPELDACLGTLCKDVASADAGKFGATMSCIDTVLREKQWLVTQHGIDTLLAALTSIISPSYCASAAKKDAGLIYLRLCQTTTNIILLHRKRIGGRFHLVVPLLQSLLTCLFTPHTYQNNYSTFALPSWVPSAATTLTAAHATAFSRILSTLSSPTASSTSLRRHTSKPALIDEIKEAKQYTGQYVPYILMHYCSLQLAGSIESELSEKVKPGLWTCMDVVDLEGMRALNEGLGKDERVMWGVLYQDWTRFGKGRGREKR